MITINKVKDFVPGVLKLFAIPIYNIQSIVNDVIAIKDENAYYKIVFANDSLQADYTPQKSENGDYYQIDISGFIPGESVQNTKVLNIIRKYRFVVIYQESDGTFRWAGNKSTGLLLNLTYSSGNADNPAKGYNLVFEGSLLNHPKPSQPYVLLNGQQIGFAPNDNSSSTE